MRGQLYAPRAVFTGLRRLPDDDGEQTVDGERLQVAQYEEGEKRSVQLVSTQIAGQSGQAVGTLRDARPVSCSRADTEIASDRGGQCRIKKSHADQRLEDGESCVAVASFCLACAGMQ
jgi:hypothetical protein